MKFLLYIFLLICPTFALGNRNETDSLGVISGTVFSSDGKPAAYVTVLIKNTKNGTITDAEGKFEFKKIKAGNYILSVSLSGYSPTEVNVEVMQNETVHLKIPLQLTYAELKEVTVKANTGSKYFETKTSDGLRLDLPFIEIPQNIAVVTHQQLTDQGLLSVSESIRNVSGVTKTYGGLNEYSLNIRGTDATYNVFRNGMSGYWWNQQEDAAMIEKIEFIKGPAGFMASFAEPGGIVNMVTKQPTKEQIANINAGFGSYNLLRLTADFGGSLNKKEKISYRINTGAHNQQRAFQFGKASRYFVCAAIKYEPGKKTSITAEYNYMRGKTSGNNDNLPSIDGKMFSLPRNFAVADSKTDRLTTGDKYYRLQLLHNFNENWRLSVQLGYVHGYYGYNWLRTDVDMPVINDTLNRIASIYDYRGFSGVTQIFIDGKFNTGSKIEHKVLLGIHGFKAGAKDIYGETWRQQKFGLYLPQPQYYVNPGSLNNIVINPPTKADYGSGALYIQDHIKIAGKLVITLAGHFTHHFITREDPGLPEYEKHKIDNKITPRAGLTWLFSDDLSVYALYDKSYWIQFAKSYDGKTFLPLSGSNLETGLKGYFFNKKLALNLSAYHIVKNNIITEDPLHNGFQLQTGQVTSNGIEFDMTGNITPALTVNANYTYSDAKITKDTEPTNIGIKNLGTPNHIANLWFKYKLLDGKWKGVSFAVGYQHMGKRSAVWYYNPDPATRFLPVHNLMDASVSYSNEKFNISLNVYNMTNINYATAGYFNADINEWRYTPGELVNFRLSLGVNLLKQRKNN